MSLQYCERTCITAKSDLWLEWTWIIYVHQFLKREQKDVVLSKSQHLSTDGERIEKSNNTIPSVQVLTPVPDPQTCMVWSSPKPSTHLVQLIKGLIISWSEGPGALAVGKTLKQGGAEGPEDWS